MSHQSLYKGSIITISGWDVGTLDNCKMGETFRNTTCQDQKSTGHQRTQHHCSFDIIGRYFFQDAHGYAGTISGDICVMMLNDFFLPELAN